jgi:uncharacterized protein (TIGR02996 family)
MRKEDAFLAAIAEDPAEPMPWLVLADWLEEQGDPRGELLRLTRILLQPGGAHRAAQEERLRFLLAQGVRPCWPTMTNSIGMKFALIPAGTFLMGSPEGEEERGEDEGPQHEVTISRPFWLGIYPVTQEQYEQVVGTNPSHFSSRGRGLAVVKQEDTRHFPVENVSWDDAVAFCRQLLEMPEEQQQGGVYRLPTEAEWEYACRDGPSSSTPFSFGRSLSSTQANFNGKYPYGSAPKGPYLERPTTVGSYPPNAFGLYDMHGNVWEWCADWYTPYLSGGGADLLGLSEGSKRVARGGGWRSYGWLCRATFRNELVPGFRYGVLGFRLARDFSSDDS